MRTETDSSEVVVEGNEKDSPSEGVKQEEEEETSRLSGISELGESKSLEEELRRASDSAMPSPQHVRIVPYYALNKNPEPREQPLFAQLLMLNLFMLAYLLLAVAETRR